MDTMQLFIAKWDGNGFVPAELPPNTEIKIILTPDAEDIVDVLGGTILGGYSTTSVILTDWLQDEDCDIRPGDFCISVPRYGFVQGGADIHWKGVYVRF